MAENSPTANIFKSQHANRFTMQYTAALCNTLQHTAAHSNTLHMTMVYMVYTHVSTNIRKKSVRH